MRTMTKLKTMTDTVNIELAMKSWNCLCGIYICILSRWASESKKLLRRFQSVAVLVLLIISLDLPPT